MLPSDARSPAAGFELSWRQMADALPGMMYMLAPAGSITFINRYFYTYTGISPDVSLVESYTSAMHPEDRATTRPIADWPLGSGDVYHAAVRLRRSDGTYRLFSTKTRAERAPDGTIVRWLGTATDIESESRAMNRERLYSRLGAALSEALSLEATVRIMVELVVPDFADWAVVHLENAAGDVVLAASQHRDPVRHVAISAALGKRFVTAESLTAEVIRSGLPRVYDVYPDPLKIDAIEPAFRDVFLTLDVHSVIVVPLCHRGRAVGAFQIVRSPGEQSLSADDLALFEEFARRVGPALERAEAYERERRVAQRFQQAALRTTLPTISGLSFDAVYEAAQRDATIGGDWYDAFRLPDGRVVLSVGDVGGSGLDAAVMMSSVRQSIRTAAVINPEPVAILDAVDRMVRGMETETLVTAVVGILDPVYFHLRYASAGHPPPLVRHPDGRVEALVHTGLPLGLRERDEGAGAQITLARDSIVAFYTDGLTEFDRDPVRGEELAVAALAANTGDATAHALYAAVAGGRPGHDDIAILTVRLDTPLTAVPPPFGARTWTFDARDGDAARRTRNECVEILESVGFSKTETGNAELVFGELLGNVVRYAPGPASVALDVSGHLPVLHVLDEGEGFEFRPRLPADVLSERGRGLFLANVFAEELSVERRAPRGSHARAIIRGRAR